MAVTALPRPHARPRLVAETLPAIVLVPPLVAPALDLLAIVQPLVAAPGVALVAAALGALVLAAAWLRYPRTAWLGAAALAAIAGALLRLPGAEVAPVLSLLALVALGVGGAFASPRPQAQSWLG